MVTTSNKDFDEIKIDHSQSSIYLNLIPELRHQIYEIVLTASVLPPISPTESGGRKKLTSLGFNSEEKETYLPGEADTRAW